MGVSELLEGLLFQVRAQLNGTPITLSDDDGWRREDAEVLIDPGYLSRAFEVAVRRLTTHVGPESSVTVAIERSARRDRAVLRVGVHLHEPSEASALFRTAEARLARPMAHERGALRAR